MNTRIYKNEFHQAFITWIKNNYKVEEETEKVITLNDITEEDEDKFHSAMFKSYDELCEIFPETFTKFVDEFSKMKREMRSIYSDLLTELIKFQGKPSWEAMHFDTEQERAAYDNYSAIVNIINAFGYMTK